MANWLKISAPIGETFLLQSLNAGPIQVGADPGAPQDTFVVKTYSSCAAVRADITNALNYQIIFVKNRGIFGRSLDAGTDTNTELTDYIGTSGNGFAINAIYYADFAYLSDPPFKPGRAWWDGNSFNLHTDIAGVTIQVGEENQVPVYNNELTTIANGQACYASGAQGQRLAVNKYGNGITVQGWRFMGLMTHDSASHSNSRLTNFGLVHDLNTQGLTVSGLVYTTSTPGIYSQTLPPGTEEAWEIGILVQAHPNQGTIMVRPRYLPRLAGITANRPTTVREGEPFFDQTLNKPIWRVGAGWVDATGASV